MNLLTRGGTKSHANVSQQCMKRRKKEKKKKTSGTNNRFNGSVSTVTDALWPLQSWFDHYLQWNQSEHPGVKNLRFTTEQVWTPDILLYNRYNTSERKQKPKLVPFQLILSPSSAQMTTLTPPSRPTSWSTPAALPSTCPQVPPAPSLSPLIVSSSQQQLISQPLHVSPCV